MEILLDLFKGFLMGFDSTIPGFSNGTLAILLNIYERLINDLSELLTHPWKIIKKDIWLGIGFVVGLVLNIVVITWLLTNYPLQTVMFFVGLVLMCIPSTFKNSTKEKLKLRDYISFAICLVVLILITLLNAGSDVANNLNVVFIILLMLMGAISAGAMIIPGISGSLIIMALGYYNVIIETLHGFLHCFAHFDFTGFGQIIITLLVFIAGVVLGLVFVSKLIKLLLDKYSQTVYSGILGLLIGSPFAIIYLTTKKYIIDWNNPWVYIAGFITLTLGILFGILMIKLEKKNEMKSIEGVQNE